MISWTSGARSPIWASHMVMPIITLAMLSIGGLMRYTRTNMLEVLNSDYIRTARAKGLSERIVINRHAFRNTLIPLVTYMSYLLPSMFVGSMITETLFQIPGIGYIAYQRDRRRRYSVYHVLFRIPHPSDAGQPDHRGHHVCRGRSARPHQLRRWPYE